MCGNEWHICSYSPVVLFNLILQFHHLDLAKPNHRQFDNARVG